MFDVVHDYGRSTAFYTSRYDADLLASSWNAANGAADRFGLDDGRSKIGRYVRTGRDDDTVAALVSKLEIQARHAARSPSWSDPTPSARSPASAATSTPRR